MKMQPPLEMMQTDQMPNGMNGTILDPEKEEKQKSIRLFQAGKNSNRYPNCLESLPDIRYQLKTPSMIFFASRAIIELDSKYSAFRLIGQLQTHRRNFKLNRSRDKFITLQGF